MILEQRIDNDSSRDAAASRRQVHERKDTLYMPVAAV